MCWEFLGRVCGAGGDNWRSRFHIKCMMWFHKVLPQKIPPSFLVPSSSMCWEFLGRVGGAGGDNWTHKTSCFPSPGLAHQKPTFGGYFMMQKNDVKRNLKGFWGLQINQWLITTKQIGWSQGGSVGSLTGKLVGKSRVSLGPKGVQVLQ